MPRVFVDTAAWVALLNTRDELHESAQKQLEALRRQNAQLITTEFVLVELANIFCAPVWRQRVVKFIDGLRRLPNLQIIPADSLLLDKGWNLFRNRPDQEWSLTDCTSMFVMESNQIKLAFSSDHHFEQAGFVKLL